MHVEVVARVDLRRMAGNVGVLQRSDVGAHVAGVSIKHAGADRAQRGQHRRELFARRFTDGGDDAQQPAEAEVALDHH